jgi:hypothetical protein
MTMDRKSPYGLSLNNAQRFRKRLLCLRIVHDCGPGRRGQQTVSRTQNPRINVANLLCRCEVSPIFQVTAPSGGRATARTCRWRHVMRSWLGFGAPTPKSNVRPRRMRRRRRRWNAPSVTAVARSRWGRGLAVTIRTAQAPRRRRSAKDQGGCGVGVQPVWARALAGERNAGGCHSDVQELIE